MKEVHLVDCCVLLVVLHLLMEEEFICAAKLVISSQIFDLEPVFPPFIFSKLLSPTHCLILSGC